MKEQVLGHGEFGPWLKENFRTKDGKLLSASTAQNYMNLADFAEQYTGFHKAQLSLRLAFDLARKAKKLKTPERPVKPTGNEKKDAHAQADYDRKLERYRRKVADNEHAEAVVQEIVKGARQRPINDAEAANIKRQMDYERADNIEAAERQAKGEKVTVSEVAASHEPERRAKQAEGDRQAVERQRAGKAAKRKATMTVDAPSLVPGGEWEWLSEIIPVLLKFARDDTSREMLAVMAGPNLNRAEVREIGRWFETLADSSQASAGKPVDPVTSPEVRKAALEECTGESQSRSGRGAGP